MASRMKLTPEEARAFLQEAMATSRNVQASFVSIRSGTHVLLRGRLEQAPDEIGFVVSDGKRAKITVDPTQATECVREDADAARTNSLAQRFFPTLEFTAALLLGFREVEILAIFLIASDKAN